MTIHLSIWWLWWFLIAVYAVGLALGMLMTLIADDVRWWERPAVLVWPIVLLALFICRLALFMAGKE